MSLGVFTPYYAVYSCVIYLYVYLILSKNVIPVNIFAYREKPSD